MISSVSVLPSRSIVNTIGSSDVRRRCTSSSSLTRRVVDVADRPRSVAGLQPGRGRRGAACPFNVVSTVGDDGVGVRRVAEEEQPVANRIARR